MITGKKLFLRKRYFMKQLLVVGYLDLHKNPVCIGTAFILPDGKRLPSFG
jgi:hypothetical protein